MDDMMDGGVIFEEPSVAGTGRAESMTSTSELPQLLIYCRELREGQNRLSAQLQAVHNNVSTLLQHSACDTSPVNTLRGTLPKKSWQSKKSSHSLRSESEPEMKATVTEPGGGKIEIPNFRRTNRVSLLSHVQGDKSPNTSKSLNSFRQIDACVDGNILRRGLTRKIFESASRSLSSKLTPPASRNNSFLHFAGKFSVKPQEPSDEPKTLRGGLEFSDLRSKVDPDSEMSMSALFKNRATELMPKTKTNTTCSPMPTTEDGDENPAPLLSRCCLLILSILLRLTGSLPWVSLNVWEATSNFEETSSAQRRVSKCYCWFTILLHVASLVCSLLTAWWTVSVALATTVSVSLGALVLCLTGPMRNNETQDEQAALMSYLENFMATGGLSDHWRWNQIKFALKAGVLWLGIVGLKIWLVYRASAEDLNMESPASHDVVVVVAYGISTACLVSALYLQAITWNGINMMIFTFAQRVLKGDWDCHDCRRNWREAVSLMRVTSRVYQRSFASLCGTTLMVFFSTLFDIHQGQALETLPSLLLAMALMVAPFVAASATAHCTRLPSLVSMIDGDEDQEAQFLDLANFLTLCESGFFMWDTRVSLGVMQKFVYFSVAIVSTIGFQLGVFHF